MTLLHSTLTPSADLEPVPVAAVAIQYVDLPSGALVLAVLDADGSVLEVFADRGLLAAPQTVRAVLDRLERARVTAGSVGTGAV